MNPVVRRKVVIADDEPITRIDLSEILTNNNYHVVGSVPTGMDAIEACKEFHPDIVIMDVKMPILDGLKAAKVINENKLAGCVILLTAYSNSEFVEKAIKAGVTGYIVKPFEEHSLLPAIEISVAKQKEISKQQEEISKLNQKIEDRIIIEKAKGILSEKRGWSERRSYDYIRKLAMDRGYTISLVAKTMLLEMDSDSL